MSKRLGKTPALLLSVAKHVPEPMKPGLCTSSLEESTEAADRSGLNLECEVHPKRRSGRGPRVHEAQEEPGRDLTDLVAVPRIDAGGVAVIEDQRRRAVVPAHVLIDLGPDYLEAEETVHGGGSVRSEHLSLPDQPSAQCH